MSALALLRPTLDCHAKSLTPDHNNHLDPNQIAPAYGHAMASLTRTSFQSGFLLTYYYTSISTSRLNRRWLGIRGRLQPARSTGTQLSSYPNFGYNLGTVCRDPRIHEYFTNTLYFRSYASQLRDRTAIIYTYSYFTHYH